LKKKEKKKSTTGWARVRQKLCPITDLDRDLSELLRVRAVKLRQQTMPGNPNKPSKFVPPDPGKIVKDGKELFKCPFKGCDKEQARFTDYKKHYITHTNERPYPCRPSKTGGVICPHRFRDAATRCRHESTHNEDQYYQCQFEGCKAAFRNRIDNLRSHQRSAHPQWKAPGDPAPTPYRSSMTGNGSANLKRNLSDRADNGDGAKGSVHSDDKWHRGGNKQMKPDPMVAGAGAAGAGAAGDIGDMPMSVFTSKGLDGLASGASESKLTSPDMFKGLARLMEEETPEMHALMSDILGQSGAGFSGDVRCASFD
jgi:hypothetical protein